MRNPSGLSKPEVKYLVLNNRFQKHLTWSIITNGSHMFMWLLLKAIDLRCLGEAVGVPVVDVGQNVVDDGVPICTRVVDGRKLAAVVSRQVCR